MSCVSRPNDLKVMGPLMTYSKSKCTYANLVQPCAHNTLRPRLPKTELTRTPGFCKLAI